ncbi:MAG: enoyl-CoA hydratase, partial [Blastomonas sp.]|nr:enoyl-CoA hydratase [Blastomonas sp.]
PIPSALALANGGRTFRIPETQRGPPAAAGGLMRLPRQIPPRIAMELALTGDFISAQRGYEIGFVNRVVEGPAIDGALELAHKISANGPLAVRVSKQVIVESRGWSDEEMWARQQAIVGPVMTSQDAREGAAAFAQKRAPNWTGK